MTQSCSQDNPPTITTAREAVVGHAEQAVQVRATTHVLEHVWQGVQEGVQAVLGRVQEAVQVHVLAVVRAVQAVRVVVHICVPPHSTNHERHKHTNNSGM